MNHLNLSHLPFIEAGYIRKDRRYQFRGAIPPHSFYRSYEYFGHHVGHFFIVQVPHSIKPLPFDASDAYTPLVIPANSFNVLIPFQIIPACRQQSGTLIFGSIGGGIRTFLAGQDLILHSAAAGNNFFDFASVLRGDQYVAIRRQGWKDVRSRSGKIDEVLFFTSTGKEVLTYAGYQDYLKQRTIKRRLDQGDIRLV